MIAHEVGHHVQNLLGISDKVQSARRGAERRPRPTRSRCGWSCRPTASPASGPITPTDARTSSKQGDVEEALDAATAIGDDRLQRRAEGRVVPESFTHGSSAQRVRWFKRGFESGEVRQCDTFAAKQL